MRVLVTGGAGYIGSHACKALARAGHEPVVLDDLSQGHRWAVRWGPLEVGDVADRGRLDEVFARHRPEAVMHFAALTSVPQSVAQPERYYGVNFSGSLALIAAARDHGVGRFVFSSTCAVHGEPPAVPVTEDMPLAPVSPYGRGKMMVEQVLRDCAQAFGLRAVALRYFNAAGADPDGELGEAHAPETHLIPLVLQAAREGAPIRVFGDDYPTPDGSCVRDYIHVADLAHAHVLALETAGDGFSAYNLGTGRGHSVLELIAAAREVTGRTVAIEKAPRRPGDPAALYADPSLASAELGFVPRRSGLADILASAWRWLSDPPAYAAGP
jgi:UDP-arabinose 4-epimerase